MKRYCPVCGHRLKTRKITKAEIKLFGIDPTDAFDILIYVGGCICEERSPICLGIG